MGDIMLAFVVGNHHGQPPLPSHRQLTCPCPVQEVQVSNLRLNLVLQQKIYLLLLHRCIVIAIVCHFVANCSCSRLQIRLIFDSGSQRSYVTDRLVDSLSLNCHHTETMIIKTFGSSKGSKQACKVVHVGLKLKDGGMLELSLLSVPLICESFSRQPITYVQENLAHIASLSLADHSYDQELDIDILIGSDQY